MRTLAIFATLLCLLNAGCGGHGNRPATYAVSGTVTYQNAPVADAEVSFQPVAEGGAHPARGKTDAGGHFQLRTYFSPSDDAAGALAGEFVVTVAKIEAPKEPVTTENVRPPKHLLPVKYSSAKTSPLKATVTAGSNTPVDFVLTDN